MVLYEKSGDKVPEDRVNDFRELSLDSLLEVVVDVPSTVTGAAAPVTLSYVLPGLLISTASEPDADKFARPDPIALNVIEILLVE